LKTFFLEFRSPVDRRFRRLKLGRYPDLSVDAARTLAKKAKGDTYAQRDPAAERVQLWQRASGEMTLETLCGRFISEYAERHRRSWKRDKARFDLAGAVYKDLWKRRISESIPADLVALHNKITVSNGPVTANRTVEAIRTAWNWTRSMRHHAVTENPADAVRRNREYSRERYLRPNEIVALLEALRVEQRRHWRDFFTLVLTLGCRKGELLTARWEGFRDGNMDSARWPWEERETEGSSLEGRSHRDAPEAAKPGEIGISLSRASSTVWEWPHAGTEKSVERDSRASKDSRSDHQ
jgi:hypothetical protein